MAGRATQNVYIVAAKRTPFGNFGGKLMKMSATDLAVHASKAAIAEAKIDPSIIDTSIWGNVAQTAADAPYLSRHVALKAGAPIESNALGLNRLCGSGFQAVVSAAHSVLLGEGNVVLCGGAESMSQAPLAAYGQHARFGHRLGTNLELVDTLWAALTDSHTKTPMGITAENLAEKYGLTREDADEVALRSQANWAAANEAGVFDAEIAPVEVKGRKGMETVAADEGPRAGTTMETLGKLPTVFKKDGTVTAGNASGITDGAAALLVVSEAAVEKHGLKPLAKVRAWASAGVDPTIMGIGPAPAVRACLEAGGVALGDIGQIEVNEAFATQYAAVEKELGLDREKTNLNGGAIALGHPLGASGARILSHLTHQMHANDQELALGTACIGGGQGIAVLLERADA